MDIKEDVSARYSRLMFLRKLFALFGLENFFKLDELFNELLSLKLDPVMGIAVRREWFHLLKQRIISTYPFIEKWDACSLEDIRQDLQSDKLREESIHVVFGDIAYLSMVNSLGGHALGDKFLSMVAQVISNVEDESVVPGRLGGDEIAIFVTGRNTDGMNNLCSEIRSAVSELRLQFADGSVKAWIDLDFADFADAINLFSRIVLDEISGDGNIIPAEARISTLINIFVGLADRRAEVGKIYTRVYMLIDLWDIDREEYYKQAPHIRKGSGGMSDENVARFSDMRKRMKGKLFQSKVLEWALRERRSASPLARLVDQEVRDDLFQEFGL